MTIPSVLHVTTQYPNDRVEASHELTRQRERQMRRFKSPGQARRFLMVRAVDGNLFQFGRHLTRVVHCQASSARASTQWLTVTCAAREHERLHNSLRRARHEQVHQYEGAG